MSINTNFSHQRIFLTAFTQFISAYQEITVTQMQTQREVIVKNRSYTEGILDVFVDLKQSLRFQKDKKSQFSFTTNKKNDREVSVFLSFETKFSTSISRKVFEDYMEYVRSHTTDIVIAGEVGRRLYLESNGDINQIHYLPLSETTSFDKDITALADYVLQYERVTVFNPYFISLVEQTTRMTNITGDIPLHESESSLQERQQRKFLYEPEGEKILQFFEAQVCASLLVQSVQEARLATISGRITSLERTYNQVESALYALNNQELKYKRARTNKKQQQRLAGMKLW